MKVWFYLNVAPTGWAIDTSAADAILAVKGGTNAYNVAGGNQAGTWTQPNHWHYIDARGWGVIDQTFSGGFAIAKSDALPSLTEIGYPATSLLTNNGATAATWRPLANVGIICTKS